MIENYTNLLVGIRAIDMQHEDLIKLYNNLSSVNHHKITKQSAMIDDTTKDYYRR